MALLRISAFDGRGRKPSNLMANIKTRLKKDEQALLQRYLLWCYKTTKESLDRIDRKFTQLLADRYILKELQAGSAFLSKTDLEQYQKNLNDFKIYIDNKEKDAWALKFSGEKDKTLKSGYRFLRNRLAAVKKSITFFLGKQQLKRIELSYEQEMVRRILGEREYK